MLPPQPNRSQKATSNSLETLTPGLGHSKSIVSNTTELNLSEGLVDVSNNLITGSELSESNTSVIDKNLTSSSVNACNAQNVLHAQDTNPVANLVNQGGSADNSADK